ncbi:MAG: hypothetical protein LC620_07590, partial [Halobacteriales archaeon]|nr:hypothetical protein [Halobacteriales archaeon]
VALYPLNIFARRLLDRLMPNVERTPEYIDSRRRVLYQAALEGAFQDATVTATERQILERLRRELRILPAEADAMEKRMEGAVARRAKGKAAMPGK